MATFDTAAYLGHLVEIAPIIVERHGDANAVVLLANRIAEDMQLHRLHLAELIALAAVRLAEHAAAVAPVSPAGPHCQGCGHPYRPGEPVHDCHEHRPATDRLRAQRLAEGRCPDCDKPQWFGVAHTCLPQWSLRGPALPHTHDPDGDGADDCAACTVADDAREVRKADR